MRIERDAVTADSRTGIESHESERFRGRGANHFPRVDVERVAKPGHLVGHADVHRAKSVFEQLCCLRDARRSNGMDVIDDVRIEMRSNERRIRRDAADEDRKSTRLNSSPSQISY